MRKLSKKEWIAVAAAIVFITYTMFGESIANSFRRTVSMDNKNNQITGINMNNDSRDSVTITEVANGSGTQITEGMEVGVNYVLKLSDGTVIQDSKLVNGGAPFNFIYGVTQLIPGWNMGIQGMKVGGKRIITIPPSLGYGSQAAGPIPANSTLIFEIEVVSAKPLQQ